MPYNLSVSIHDCQYPSIFQVDASGHLAVTAATRNGTDTSGVQGCDEVMNTVIDTLHTAIEWHANLISECLFASWRVTMPTGCFSFYVRHLGI